MCDDIRKILAEQVPNGFTTTEYPGDDNIVYDNSSYYSDIVETFDSFKGKHWSQLAPDVVLLNTSHIPFLTIPAFCFYLPAYLLTIATYSGYIDNLLETTLYYLTPPEVGGEGLESFSRRVECFTSQQRDAVKTLISLFICNSYGSEYRQVYQSDPDLMRAIAFWGYTENSL